MGFRGGRDGSSRGGRGGGRGGRGGSRGGSRGGERGARGGGLSGGRGGARQSSGGKRVVEINKAIKAHGDMRQIDDALAAFASFDELGLQPTAVSFNVILFALVKCDELAQAQGIYEKMLAREDVQANVVTLTSLLKGHCGAGDMQSASALLDHMAQSEELRPNTRTLNTFLRGCLWTGDVDRATRAFRQLCSRGFTGGGVRPDATSVDYLLRLLATSLRIGEARKIFEEHANTIDRTPFPLVALGEACALTGDSAAAKDWLGRASSVLSSAALLHTEDDEAADDQRPGIANFVAHQRAELQQSVERIQLSLESGSSRESEEPPRKRRKGAAAGELPALLVHALGKTLLFSSTGRVGHHGESGETRDAIVAGLTDRLGSLGLPAAAAAAGPGSSTADSGEAEPEQGTAYYSRDHYGEFGASKPGVKQFLNGTTCCGCHCDGGKRSFPCKKKCCDWACGACLCGYFAHF